MKKKILVLLSFLIFSLLSFSQINDNSDLFTKTQKEEISKKVDEIEKDKKISLFINTFSEDEGFVINNPEKALILNLKKIAEEKYKVELSFSKDIDIEEKKVEIEKLFDEKEKILEDKEYSDYVIAILDGVVEILADVNMAPLGEMTLSEHGNEEKSFVNYYLFAGLGAFLLCLIIIIIYFIYNKKQK